MSPSNATHGLRLVQKLTSDGGVPLRARGTSERQHHAWICVKGIEVLMSRLNGDKARYQRLRKAGLRRRERARAVTAARQVTSAPLLAERAADETGGEFKATLAANHPTEGGG